MSPPSDSLANLYIYTKKTHQLKLSVFGHIGQHVFVLLTNQHLLIDLVLDGLIGLLLEQFALYNVLLVLFNVLLFGYVDLFLEHLLLFLLFLLQLLGFFVFSLLLLLSQFMGQLSVIFFLD